MVVTTVPVTAWTVMRGKLRYLNENGFEVLLVSSPGEELERTAEREGVRAVGIPMSREIRPWRDAVSLVRLFRLMRLERPRIVLTGTPKAGLLASLAASLSGVPVRIYMLLGLRLETATGGKRILLWATEWIAIHAVHHVVVASPSLLVRARDLKLLRGHRGVVLGRGSSNGVDIERFAATPDTAVSAAAARRKLKIPQDAFIFGFVGRLTVDKGVGELATAFHHLARQRPDVWLLVVGDEDPEGLPVHVRRKFESAPHLRFTGWLRDPTITYHIMDALVLPTYREGFPNVPLEAAAAGKPVITTTATGAVDSVVHESTGLLVRPRDTGDLTRAMTRLVDNRQEAREMGARGLEQVRQNFSNEVVWAEARRFIRNLV